MHTHYYVHRSRGTQISNKLQKEISEFLRSLDGNLIDAVDLPEFQNKIIETIEALNKKYARCKPFKVSFDNVISDRCIRLSGYYCEIFYLYKATLTHLSTVEYKSLSNN